MADYAIIQIITVGPKTINMYMTKMGNNAGCFADSSISCGRNFDSVSQAHYQLMLKFPRLEFEMVNEDFLDKDS